MAGAPRGDDAAATAAAEAVRETYLREAPAWIGAEIRGERRLDAFLDPERDEARFVLSLAIDGASVPETIAQWPHVPYDAALVDACPPRGDAIGAFACLEAVYSPAERVRFRWHGDIREAPVRAGYALLVAWDTPWIATAAQPRPVALLVDGAWLPTVSTVVAATATDFGACYARDHAAYGAKRDPREDWAASSFHDDPTFDERIAMVEAVLDVPDLSDHAWGCLAAGPVEDLIGHDFLDYAMRDVRNRGRYIPLLRGTYWSREPPDIRERMRAILGGADEYGAP